MSNFLRCIFILCALLKEKFNVKEGLLTVLALATLRSTGGEELKERAAVYRV